MFQDAIVDSVQMRSLQTQLMRQLFAGIALSPAQDSTARGVLRAFVLERGRLNDTTAGFMERTAELLRRRDRRVLEEVLSRDADRVAYLMNATKHAFFVDTRQPSRP